jgi:hypothetical protein
MGFSAKQVKALRRNLDQRYVRTREANSALDFIPMTQRQFQGRRAITAAVNMPR